MAAAASFDFVVAGAGIAALSSARYLARLAPTARIALVSPHAPMSQTSSLSTECFRDHWPSPDMRAFMARSITLIGQHAEGGAFRTAPLGYLYASRKAGAADAFLREAAACHGSGGVRVLSSVADARAIGSAPFAPSSPLAKGADVFTSNASTLAAFPYLAADTTAALHARNAGWLVSAHTMGMDLFDGLLARTHPRGDGSPLTTLINGSVIGADFGPSSSSRSNGGRIQGVIVSPTKPGSPPMRLQCGAFINASGPFLASTHADILAQDAAASSSALSRGESAAAIALAAAVARGAPPPTPSLPVTCEVHAKVIFRDVYGVIPRHCPQVILSDAVSPEWTGDELQHIAEGPGGQAAADKAARVMPMGAHLRPYGGDGSNAVLLLWESWHHGVKANQPPPASADAFLEKTFYPDIALRGLARIIPGLRAYYDEDAHDKWMALRKARHVSSGATVDTLPEVQPLREPLVDGGYYTKTVENLPLIGPAPGVGGLGVCEGVYLCGALSGYGLMAAHAAGELVAMHATGASDLPSYAGLMSPLRYQDTNFTRAGGVREQLIAGGGGQL